MNRMIEKMHPLRVIGMNDGQQIMVEDCDVLFGGKRHLALCETSARKLAWVAPFADNRALIAEQLDREQKVGVLATGDPLCFGVGETLIDWFGAKMVQVVPAPSAFALACAAMGWKQQGVTLASVHGRPITDLHPLLHQGARLVVLGEGKTAASIATMLRDMGLGHSKIKALSHLGGPAQSLANHPLDAATHYAELTCYAVECQSDGSAEALALGPGLPDALFAHDGTMTKRDIRAVTVAKLAPRNGQVFWDIGVGNGSVAIEIARLAPHARVFGIDDKPERLKVARANAKRLAGANRIGFATGQAPQDIPDDWPRPDAIFIGGGLSHAGMVEALWHRLPPGGRMVANAVTLEGEAALLAHRKARGGVLTRISVAREEAVGPHLGLKQQMAILQYEGRKTP